jgi:hypothetical protein
MFDDGTLPELCFAEWSFVNSLKLFLLYLSVSAKDYVFESWHNLNLSKQTKMGKILHLSIDFLINTRIKCILLHFYS